MPLGPEAITKLGGPVTPELLIARFEGCRLNAYQDEGGVWTVGYGCTGEGIGPDTAWTQAQADAELASRVATMRAHLGDLIKCPLSPEQYAAVCSLVWNIGIGAFSASTVLRRLNAYDYNGASDAWTDPQHIFDKVNGQISDGLVTRRRTEAALFIDGTDQTPTPSPIPG